MSTIRVGSIRILLFSWALSAVPIKANSGVFSIGPGHPYESIGAVPWESLQAGDLVKIHWRPDPYREKWVICSEGTLERPIRITGVPNLEGERPVIDGREAVTRPVLDFWNEDRGVIKVGGSSHAAGIEPRHVIIENLDIRSARPGYFFSGRKGRTAYRRDAAALYIETGESITVRSCRLSDSGNGLFVNGRDVLVEHCEIVDNGIEDSFTEHNVYSAAEGITFQFNTFGPLRSDCAGNNLKDRSAGLVVRHNWFTGGSRQLDLVDAEDHGGRLVALPSYRETFVYGNVIEEGPEDFRSEIVHYGGDSIHSEWYRRGVLYFYHNTVVSRRKDLTVLFRLSSENETAEIRNNIFFLAEPRGRLALSHGRGTFRLRKNWLSRGWVKTSRWLFRGDLVQSDTMTGTAPGFRSDDRENYELHLDGIQSMGAVALHPEAVNRHPVRIKPDSMGGWVSVDEPESLLIGAWVE